MKKEHLKSIGLILLGGVLTLSVSSLVEKSYASENNHNTIDWEHSIDNQIEMPDSEENEVAKAKVYLQKAQQDIAAYQMWLKYMPKYASLDSLTRVLTYSSKIIEEEDFEILKTYLKGFLKTNTTEGFSTYHFPFYASLAKSYYIDKSKIKYALNYDTNATGINVHLGVRGLENLSLKSMESHLYVVPTSIVTFEGDTTLHDILIDNKFALDLTHPCPAMCSTGELYEPKLVTYSEYKKIPVVR